MFQTKVEEIKTRILYSIFFFFENRGVYEIMWKNTVEPGTPQMTNTACASHSVYLRLQIHTQDMKNLLFFHCSNGCTSAQQCYVIRTLAVLFESFYAMHEIFRLKYCTLYKNFLVLGVWKYQCHKRVMGSRDGVVVKALRYKPEGRGFDSRWCHWNFSVT
jgi:hypothetical protein